VGTVSNRDAVGARVEVLDGAAPSAALQVTGGGSYLSHSDRRLHVVLPASAAGPAHRLRIRWPSGIVQEVGVERAAQDLTIVEAGAVPGGGDAAPVGGAP